MSAGPAPGAAGAITPDAAEGVTPRWMWWAMAAVVLVAAVLRVRLATLAPMWFDEIYTVWIARSAPREILVLAAQDVHPPLHFLLVAAWRAIGGESEVWLRLSSVVCGVALVAIVFPFGRAVFGARAGLLAAALLALHRTHIYFSTELRYFSLLWLWLTLATWMAWRWVGRGRSRDGVLYASCAGGALYTHYLSGIVLAFVGLWGLVVLRRDRRRAAGWIGLHALAALAFLPQLPVMLHQMVRETGEHWIRPPRLSHLIEQLRHLCFGVRLLIPPMFALALLPLLRAHERRGAALLWTLSLGPTLLCWELTRHGMHLYNERYMFFMVPVWCVLIAAGLAGLPWTRVRWAAMAMVLVIAGRSGFSRPPLAESRELAQAAAYLRSHATPGDTLFCGDTHSLLFARHYLHPPLDPVLIWLDPHLPYYEGALVIPESWRFGPVALDSLRSRGRSWWAIRTHPTGVDSRPAARRFAEIAGPPVFRTGRVTLWAGGVVRGRWGTLVPAEAPSDTAR